MKGSRLQFSGWTLDTGRRQLTAHDGVLVELSGGEYELLIAFLERPQIVLNRDQLLDITRGRFAGPFDRARKSAGYAARSRRTPRIRR